MSIVAVADCLAFGRPLPEDEMPKYLLLLQHQPGAYDGLSPDDMQALVTRYRTWVQRLRDAGAYLGSEKLSNDGRTLRGAGPRLKVSDGPYVEGKELIAGFYLLDATDYEAAVKLASDCPALERSIIEIRHIAGS